jgi:DNA polymerase III psi subunit
MIFVDIRNVLKSVQLSENKVFRLDFYTLAIQLLDQRELVAAYIFDTQAPFGENDSSRNCTTNSDIWDTG